LVTGYFFEQRELGFIEEKGEKESWSPYSFQGRLIVIAISGILAVLFLSYSLPMYFGWGTLRSYLMAFSLFFSPLAPIMFRTRIWLLKRCQQEHQKEIIFEETALFPPESILHPKFPNQSNLNNF
jgi:hypothetical protein